MRVRSLGFRTDLMLRRLSGATVTEHDSYLAIHTPSNPGFWWGNFLLVPQPPQPGEPWEQVFTAEFPGTAHRAIGVDNTDGDTGTDAALQSLGLTSDVSVVLAAASLADPRPLAASTQVRPLADDDDWDQCYALRLACDAADEDGLGDRDADADAEPEPAHALFLQRRQDEVRRLTEAGHGAWFGAFLDGQLRASLGLFSDGAGYARFQSVDTHPDFRRQGLARAMLTTAAQWGGERFDSPTFVIVADPNYFAIDLYHAVGFHDVELQVQLQREV